MVDELSESNAVIESTRLDIERGFLTGWVFLDYGGSVQGFGGHVLGGNGLGVAGLFIKRILEVVGSETWEGLKGRPCRARHDNGKVYAIGNYLRDNWFDINTEFEMALGESE